MTKKMPRSSLIVRNFSTTVGQVILNLTEYNNDPEKAKAMYPWANRFICGYPVPDFQRPICWSDEQQSRFINSIWMDIPLGSYMLNDWRMSDGKTFDTFSNILLDGQQRLFAIERYITGQIRVPDMNGEPCLWSELARSEQFRFKNRVFSKEEVSIFDENRLRELYDLRNFGGVAHTEEQRAVDANNSSNNSAKEPHYQFKKSDIEPGSHVIFLDGARYVAGCVVSNLPAGEHSDMKIVIETVDGCGVHRSGTETFCFLGNVVGVIPPTDFLVSVDSKVIVDNLVYVSDDTECYRVDAGDKNANIYRVFIDPYIGEEWSAKFTDKEIADSFADYLQRGIDHGECSVQEGNKGTVVLQDMLEKHNVFARWYTPDEYIVTDSEQTQVSQPETATDGSTPWR